MSIREERHPHLPHSGARRLAHGHGKTEAGTRTIPMGSLLEVMLLDWRLRCRARAASW
jgi:hypothetical protein